MIVDYAAFFSNRTGRKIVGGVLTPLLSNLYMRRFILGWKHGGHERHLSARIVNYADDLVICCRGTAAQAMQQMRAMMARLKLSVNEERTAVRRVPEETFDFLGYTFGRCYCPKTGRAYIGTRPSKRAVQRLKRVVHEATTPRWRLTEVEGRVSALNRKLVGWAGYFKLGPVDRAYRAIDAYTRHRLRQWLGGKHGQRGQGTSRYPDAYFDELGLVRLARRPSSFPWAKA